MLKLQLIVLMLVLFIVDGSAMNNEQHGGRIVNISTSVGTAPKIGTKNRFLDANMEEPGLLKDNSNINIEQFAPNAPSDLLLDEKFIKELDETLSDSGKLDEDSIQKASKYAEEFLKKCLEAFDKNSTEATCLQLGCAYIMFLQRLGGEAKNTEICKRVKSRKGLVNKYLYTIPEDKLLKAKSNIEKYSSKIFIMSVIGGYINDLINDKK
jgi:hypothetical protein